MNNDPIREPKTPLDRLWEATRPEAPSARDWDRVWATISAGLDQPESAAVVPFAPPARRFGPVAIGLMLAAQAAAVLLALGLTFGRFGDAPGTEPNSAIATVRIEEGQLVLIRDDAGAAVVAELAADEGADGVDAWYLVYNLLESLANPVVAMSE